MIWHQTSYFKWFDLAFHVFHPKFEKGLNIRGYSNLTHTVIALNGKEVWFNQKRGLPSETCREDNSAAFPFACGRPHTSSFEATDLAPTRLHPSRSRLTTTANSFSYHTLINMPCKHSDNSLYQTASRGIQQSLKKSTNQNWRNTVIIFKQFIIFDRKH